MMTDTEALLLESLTRKNKQLVDEIEKVLAERDFLRLENQRLHARYTPPPEPVLNGSMP